MKEMTMVERVARAICDSLEADDFDSLGDRSIVKAAYLQQARAAIWAMREPTQGMVTSGTDAATMGDEGVFRILIDKECAAEAWTLMIDAALNEHDGA